MSGQTIPQKERILVVDDEPGLAQAVSRWLTAAKYEVDIAFDGNDADQRLQQTSYDLVLCDIVMPGMDGIELLKRIHSRDADLPVILMTATPSIESAALAVDYGAARYILKPMVHEDLLASTEKALRMRRMAQLKRQALDLLAEGGLGIGDAAGLEMGFNNALATLWMAFQPIISWKERRVYGYEALVRTHEPSLPHPGALFDAAERLGKVAMLGARIREAAAIAFADAPPDAHLFVNLHMLDLAEQELYSPDTRIAKLAHRVVLEVTERCSFDTIKNLRARAAVLRRLGYRMAVDDLGAGYAGLTSFALLEPEVVKLDMSLIRDVHREPTKQRIVRSMISLCTEGNLLVVAEGIETTEERDMLATLGADLMQGFLFARPAAPFPTVAWEIPTPE